MKLIRVSLAIAGGLAFASVAAAQNPPAGNPPAATPPQQQQPGGTPAQGGGARRPRPYAQVITDRAHTERGGITMHKVDERYFFEVPDSLLNRDILLVKRLSGEPAVTGGFHWEGTEHARRVVRWEKVNDRVQLRSFSYDVYADDSLPINISVRANNYSPILAAFPIAAFTRDSNSYVVDVTDFFSGDIQAISGMPDAARRQ
jgi:hypothetical protein